MVRVRERIPKRARVATRYGVCGGGAVRAMARTTATAADAALMAVIRVNDLWRVCWLVYVNFDTILETAYRR